LLNLRIFSHFFSGIVCAALSRGIPLPRPKGKSPKEDKTCADEITKADKQASKKKGACVNRVDY
jgi:hypothetical protein